MIEYPVPSHKRFVIYNTTLGKPIKFNKTWPRADGGPIVGAPEDEVWLEIKYGPRPSDIDQRFYQVVTTEGPDVENEEYWYTYAPQRYPNEVIAQNIDNTEASEFERHFEATKALKYLAKNIAMLWQSVSNQELTDAQKLAKRQFLRRAAKIVGNEQKAEAYKAAVELGETPNLEAEDAWEAPVTPEEDV